MAAGARASLVRRLEPDDAALFMSLRLAALLDAPFASASSPGDDLAHADESVPETLASADQAAFGA